MAPSTTPEFTPFEASFRMELWRFVRARVACDADADDVVQAVLERLHRSLEDGAVPNDPRAWIYAVARNAIVDRGRASGALERGKERWASEPTVSGEVPPPASTDVPEHDLSACLAPLLHTLDPDTAQALAWTDMGEMTQAEAAAAAGITVSGMKSRVQRGRQKLRAMLERCCTIEVDARGAPVRAERRGEPCPCSPDDG